MEMTIIDVLNSQRALASLSNKPLPVKTSLQIARLLSKVEEEVKIAETQRVKLVEKYGVASEEKPNVKTVPKENMEAFAKEFNVLLQQKVDINYIPITINDLGNIEITPADLRNLQPFLAE